MDELLKRLKAFGCDVAPDFSGEWIVFDRGGKSQNGRYKGREVRGPHGPVYKAYWKDWATGEEGHWRSDENTQYSPEELEALKLAEDSAAQGAKEEKLKRQAEAAAKAKEIWEKAKPAVNHPYCLKKGIIPGPAKQDEYGNLLVPIYAPNHKLVSLQFIAPNGEKRFLTGGQKRGCYTPLRNLDSIAHTMHAHTLYIVEGFATGMSVHLATGQPVYVAFDSGNLPRLAEELADYFKMAKVSVVIAADNDQWAPGNPGLAKAVEAAAILGKAGVQCGIKAPDFDRVDISTLSSKPTDWNDFQTLYGLDSLKAELLTANGETSNLPPALGNARAGGFLSLDDLTQTEIEPLEWKIPRGGSKPVAPSQDRVASALDKYFGEHLIREKEDTFLWTRKHWHHLDRKEFLRWTRDRSRILMSGDANDKALNAYHNILMDKLDRVPEGMSFWKQMPNLCNFLDGTLEITREKNTGKYTLNFREHRKEDLLTWILPYEYKAPRPKNPVFDEWLARCFEGDQDASGKIRALKQIGGAALISLFPRLAFLYGVPGTGKSTFAKLCMRFMGENNYSNVPPGEQEGFLKETMINRQANIVTDISDAEIDVGQWKRVEDRVPELINRKGIVAVKGYLPALHVYCGNTLPKGFDATTAFDRRVTIVEFLNSVTGDENHTRDFEDIILTAGPGAILDFFEEGLRDLCASGGKYFNPETGRQKLQEAKAAGSLTSLFLEAVEGRELHDKGVKIYFDKNHWLQRSVIGAAYCTFVGRTCSPKEINAMYQDLIRRGFEQKTVRGARLIHGFWVEGKRVADTGADNF